MQPNSCELLRPSAEVNLTIEKVCDRIIIELHTYASYLLLYRYKVLHEQQVIRLCNSKAAYLVVGLVPEIQQLCPCSRAESEDWFFKNPDGSLLCGLD